jgi:hypothetical protein
VATAAGLARDLRPVAIGLVAAAATLAVLLTPLRPLGLLALLLVAALELPAALGPATRLFVGSIVTGSAVMVVALVPAALQLQADPRVLVPIAVGIGASRAVTRRPSAGRLSWGDATLAATVVATTALFLTAWSRRTPGGRIALMLPGEDNSAHLGLTTAARAAGGYLFRGNDPFITTDLQTYPQGAHVATAITAWTVGAGTGPAGALATYTISLLLSVAFLAGAFVLVAARAAAACGVRHRAAPVAAGVAAVALIGGPLLALMQNGFFSQLWAYVLLLVLVAVCVDPDLTRRPWLQLTCVALLGCGIAATYYFLLAVAGAAVLPVLWQHRTPIRASLSRAGVVTLVCLLGLVPVAVSLGSGAAGSINAPGGIFPMDRTVLLRTLLIALAVAVLLAARRTAIVLAPVYAALLASVLFGLVLRQQAIAATGTTGYYYEKALYTTFLLAVAATAVGAVFAADRLLEWSARPALAAGGLAALSAGVATLQLHPSAPILLHQLKAGQQEQAFDRVLRDLPAGRTPPVLWHYGTPVEDYIASRMLSATYHRDDVPRQEFELRSARTAQADLGVLSTYLAVHPEAGVITRDPDVAAALRDSRVVVQLYPK